MVHVTTKHECLPPPLPPLLFDHTATVLRVQETAASSAEAESTRPQDPNDRAIGGARNRRPLGGAATDVTPAGVSTDGDGVVSDSAAAADGDEPAAPAVGIKPWERKKRVAAVKKKPSVDDGGEGAAMGGEVGGEEEAAAASKAAPAKPWKSKAKSSRANQPAEPWQKRAPSDGAEDGEGRDAGEIKDLNNGGLEAAPAGVTKPSGNGEGGRGSVDELEAALEHREWKWRLAVFKVWVLLRQSGSGGHCYLISVRFGSSSIRTRRSVYAWMCMVTLCIMSWCAQVVWVGLCRAVTVSGISIAPGRFLCFAPLSPNVKRWPRTDETLPN